MSRVSCLPILLTLTSPWCRAQSHPVQSHPAQSHPTWWSYASPEATALVGINWENLQHSPFAEAVQAELSSGGSLGFPDLDCLKQARQILISSPELLAVEAGTFPAATLRAQALAHDFRPAIYKSVPLWLAPAGEPGVAAISEQLVLVGAREALEAAIDRAGPGGVVHDAQRLSSLLPRAARFSHADLWVVSSQLPDPLASLFVPLEVQAGGFDGSVSLRDGLDLEASLEAGSYEAAVALAKDLRISTASLPAIAQGLKIGVEEGSVMFWLRATKEDLAASLRAAPKPVVPEAAAKPAAPPPAVPKPPERQVIRILGLDDGPREIPFPDR